jgi:hypothetical protein
MLSHPSVDTVGARSNRLALTERPIRNHRETALIPPYWRSDERVIRRVEKQIRRTEKRLGVDDLLSDSKYKRVEMLFRECANHQVYIETGLQFGNFSKIFSIEIEEDYVRYGRMRFSVCPHIKILHGSSDSVLRSLLSELAVPCTFWLDAHPEGAANPWPLLNELEIIAHHQINTHTILVDDRRNLGRGAAPTEDEVMSRLLSVNKAYDISFWDGRVEDDIIVARIS